MTFFIQFPFSSSSCSHTPIPIGRPSSYPPSSKGTPQVSDVSPLSLSSTPPEVSCIVLFQKISIPSPCKTYWFRAPPPPPPPPPLLEGSCYINWSLTGAVSASSLPTLLFRSYWNHLPTYRTNYFQCLIQERCSPTPQQIVEPATISVETNTHKKTTL